MRRQLEGYQSVRKWTSKTDIFAKRYIFIPINEKCVGFDIHLALEALMGQCRAAFTGT